jgi:hypothetical protein
MKAIASTNAHGIPFAMQMVIHALNQHQLETFALGAAALGAKGISFGMTQPTGTYLDSELFISRAGWTKIQDRIERLMSTLSVPVTYTEGFRTSNPLHECQPFRSEILHVDYDGHLNLCCMHAGVPGGDDRSSSIADLNVESLVGAHRKMLEVVHTFRRDKIDRLEKGACSGWDLFPCTSCLEYFGKPHWSDEGAKGPAAKRARWRGAWSPERHTGTSVPVHERLRVVD